MAIETQPSKAQRIRRIAEGILGLPTLPTVVSKMIRLVDSPKTTTSALARLISSDQSLTARILKMANSAYYGFSREIATVNTAIVVMGFNAVKDLGLSLSVFDMFKEAESVHAFDPARFWEHSIGCGVAGKVIASVHHPQRAGEAFVGGLLHDIGKVVLNQYAHEEFLEIMGRVTSNDEILEDAELSVIGVGHGTIGGWLTDKWKLPPFISECIYCHHNPQEAKIDPVLTAIISLSDVLCHRAGVGNSGRVRSPEPSDCLWEIFRNAGIPLCESSLDTVETEFLLEFDRNDTLLSFVHDDGGTC